jgi:hypothetical protein
MRFFARVGGIRYGSLTLRPQIPLFGYVGLKNSPKLDLR